MRCKELYHRVYNNDGYEHIGYDCECYVEEQKFDGCQNIIGEGISTDVIPMNTVMLSGGYMSAYDCIFFQFGRNIPMDMRTFQEQCTWYDPKRPSTICNYCVKDMLRKGEIRWMGGFIKGPYMCDVCNYAYEDDPPYKVDYDNNQMILREHDNYDYNYHCNVQNPPIWFQPNHVLCQNCFDNEKKSFDKKERVRFVWSQEMRNAFKKWSDGARELRNKYKSKLQNTGSEKNETE